MPSKTDFNVSPYFDDFSEDKKFHRVMYRPAFAVQARELTTQQSIAQNQIEKLGDHMFKNGAMVIPGETTVDLDYQAVKLTSFTGTFSNFFGSTVTGGTSGITAEVIDSEPNDGDDPDTLFVKYKDSGTDNASNFFIEGESLSSDAAGGETAVVSTTADGSAVRIAAGTYYINGYFVNVDAQRLILDKYTNTPDYRIGLYIRESFTTSTDDTSLLDNATGSSNANATGAHRFKIELVLAKLNLQTEEDDDFVELIRIDNGIINHKVETTAYSLLEDTLARRTYDESGDYSVMPFDIDVRESLDDGENNGIYLSDGLTTEGNLTSDDLLAIGMGAGKAYVKGFEVKKIGTQFIDLEKARDFQTDSGLNTRFTELPFINITNLHGTPDVGFVSDETEVYKKVRLVDTEHATRGTAQVNNDGTVFDIGRAKTRGIEHNSGDASGNFMSSASVESNTYKHYLFDTVMFAHLNVKGAMSGALTEGDTLTGGSSGATAIIESITQAGVANITGVTQTSPPVVTISAGHNFTEGQQVNIENVGGMVELQGFRTVKNPTATTFEVHGFATATLSTPEPPSLTSGGGTNYTPYTSGGTISHTVIVLSDVNGEFSPGETITAPTNSRTGVVQFNAFGCKGFQQKDFTQTKGVSSASDPVFTADVDLTEAFGDVETLTGTISTVDTTLSFGSIVMDGSSAAGADAGDAIILEDATDATSAVIAIGLEPEIANTQDKLFGSGTRFLTELKIGDQITFEDNANNTIVKIIQSIASNTEMETVNILGSSTASNVAFKRQRTKVQFSENDTSLFKLPYEVVKTLLTTVNGGISDTSFKIRRQFVATLSNAGSTTITAGTNETFSAFTENDFTVSVMAKGGSASAGEVGDVVSLAGSGLFVLGGSPSGKTLTINLGSTFNGSKIKILATVSTSVADAKTKTATNDKTKTFDDAASSGLTKLNLGFADVFNVQSVYMSADFNTAATITDTLITDRFTFDTGQRDNYYDIGSLVRIPGKPAPSGRLLVTFDYYEHGAGNFFSVDSYSGIDYGNIPVYISDVTGEEFALRDCLDFRPRVDNASTINAGDGQDRQYIGTGASTIEFAKFNSDITNDLEHYLAKKAKVFMMPNGQFEISEGDSSANPQEPEILTAGMHLYDLFLPAFTYNPSDVTIKKVDNRRYTMRDIGRLEQRIESVEYYTQLSLLESEAQNMQIQDADGFDRFKNGIIVDNFTGHSIGDVTDNDYSVAMDMAQGELRPAFSMDNISLKEIDSDITTEITNTSRTSLGYQKTGSLITLPYTAESFINQPYASTTINLNPYDTIPYTGQMTLSPDQDEWMDTRQAPDFIHHIPGTYDTLKEQASQGLIDLNLGTVWNNWNDSWTGAVQEGNKRVDTARSGNVKTTTTTISTTQRVGRVRSGVRTSLVPNEVRKSIGNRVLSTSFVPFMRSKTITFHATGMKPNTRVYAFFDDVDVNDNCTAGLRIPVNNRFTSQRLRDQVTVTSNKGAALTSDSNGTVTGSFTIPGVRRWNRYVPDGIGIVRAHGPVRPQPCPPYMGFPGFGGGFKKINPFGSQKRFRTGTKTFRLTSNINNSLVGDIFTSAEADYTASGLQQTVQGQIVSTRQAKFVKTVESESTTINRVGSKKNVSTEIIERRRPPEDPPRPPSARPTPFPSPGGGPGSNPPICHPIYNPGTNPNESKRDERTAAGLGTNTRVTVAGGSLTEVFGNRSRPGRTITPAAPVNSRRHRGTRKTKPATPRPVRTAKPKSYGPPRRGSRGGRKPARSRPSRSHHCRYRDPVAQSFLIDTTGGVFVPSIDLYFSNKSTNQPVQVQIRTMQNGYPTREIVPFADTTVDAAQINVSSDAKTATTFTFPSPVYLAENEEYAFVVLSNSKNYTMYTARMGQKTIDDARLISKQPYLGSMFKSQNAFTWTPEQNEDVKFNIKFCSFTEDTIGDVYLVNDAVPDLLLDDINPITTTASSGVITIRHRNHGMHSTQANVTISGVPSGSHNGIDSTNINGTYSTIGNIKLDSYTVTAKNSDTATSSGDIGGTDNVSASRNILYDIVQPIIGNVIHQDTTLVGTIRTTGGRTLEGSETEYSLETEDDRKPVAINSDYYQTKPGMIASPINETNEMSGSKSFVLNLSLYTPFGANNLSPVIDTSKMSLHLIQNRLTNPISGTTPDFVAETTNEGGSAGSKYITRPILLENPATSLDIRLSANIRDSGAVKMFYRTTSTEDVRLLKDVAWVAFNTTGIPDTAVPPAKDNDTFREQQYSDTGIPGFTAFALKIVLTGTNSSYPPIVKDMRGIALAV